MTGLTAAGFLERLDALRDPAELVKYRRYFPERHHEFIGVRMGQVFGLAKDYRAMEPAEIERLLEADAHEARAGAVRIMAEQAKQRSTTDERRRELCELYLRRHDRIDDWDLVDLGAWEVVGRALAVGRRDVLDRLAASPNPWERRTSILATFAFIRLGQLDDTYRIAETLSHDEHDLVAKAVGWALRGAGDIDPARHAAFLDTHAATLPRVALRNAVERLEPTDRARYLGRRTASS